jgi:hypothetical protein
MQIRVGDHSFSGRSQFHDNQSLDLQLINQYYNFFSCAYELADVYKRESHNKSSIGTGQTVIIFLACDSMQLRRAALRRWQLPHICLNKSAQSCAALERSFNLIATTDPLQHTAHTNDTLHVLQSVMMETFLFSICQEHIFTLESGFGRVPAFAALNFRNVYSFTYRDRPSCLHPDHGTKLEVSAHHQAGIR